MSRDILPLRLLLSLSSVVLAIGLLFIIITSASAGAVAKSDDRHVTIAGNFQSATVWMTKAGSSIRQSVNPSNIAASVSSAITHGASTAGRTFWGGMSTVGSTTGGALYTVATTAVNLPNTARRAVSLDALIRPSEYAPVPVIKTDSPAATLAALPAAAPAPEAPAPPPAASAKTEAPPAAAPVSSIDNDYVWGNCTWWAAGRRAQAGNPIPNSWGNAAWWARGAVRDGYVVDHTPNPGAIMQTANSAGGLGHVAFVESVDPDGTWHISEMNVAGLGVISHNTYAPSVAASYNFIH